MRVAVYGGTFDPPHVAHAMVAAWLLWTDRVDEVWLVPTYEHALEKDMGPFSYRLSLCRALAEDLGGHVRASDIESHLERPSYTLRTLEALARRHPEHGLRLVVGADILDQRDRWWRWERIARDFPPLVVGREGYPPVAEAPTFPGVSSTEIRRRLAEGRRVDHLVPASVLRVREQWLEARADRLRARRDSG